MKTETRLLHALPHDPLTGAVSVPIYQTTTFEQEGPGINKGFDYSRTNNPTRQAFEQLLAELEGGTKGIAFSSGLAAVDAVLKLLSAGDEVIAVDDIYGGTYRALHTIYNRLGITVKHVDTSDPGNVLEAITPRTKLVWLETPTNPTLKVSDIRAIASISKASGALLLVDNTFGSPVAQQPLKLGADIVLHSITKYIAGHSDVIGGGIVVKDEELGDRIKYIQNATGAVLGPQDSWLAIRGAQTLHLRYERISRSAQQVAEFLQQHPAMAGVNYPGLRTHPNHLVARSQSTAFGGVISFWLNDDREGAAVQLVKHTRLFTLAESLGGVKSLLCVPARMTHASVPREARIAAGIHDSLVRISIGLEHPDDLVEDLAGAISAAENCSAEQTLHA
ncbi:MAG TPA: PLP-dependent aspartate aminotransferase family protein [Flavobacteriales bacterium]|nr:PLP-dependent aspartate aminotransferase family protein [Flavobacteriales bacterium]HNM70817.1 PLP-dependent aspartate aminotransferase family protein [Flavobacteriales bacterium]